MDKFSTSKGFTSPLIIVGVAVLGIVVFLVASGSLKFSGYVKTNSPREGQGTTPTSGPTAQPEKSTEEKKPEVKLSSEPFTDSKLGFSISYPDGWKVSSTTTGVNILKPSSTKGQGQADALVSVVVGDLGDLKDTKLPTIADLHKVYIKKQFGNVEFGGEGEVKVNGQDGYGLEFTGTVNSENIKAKYTVLKGAKNLFALVEVANAGEWKGLEGELDASVQTFKTR